MSYTCCCVSYFDSSHQENMRKVIKQLHHMHYELSKMDILYTYKVWNLALYSYGEATEYRVLRIDDCGTNYVRVSKKTHIIRDTHNIGKFFVPRKSSSQISF